MLLTYSYSLLANLVNSMHRSNSRGGRRVLEPFYGFPVRSVGEEEVFLRPHCRLQSLGARADIHSVA